MISKPAVQFIRDERGSYTVWSLVWFMLYVVIGGLAVDATDAFNKQTLLQATADAAALAGVMSLPDQDDAVDQALAYASANMSQNSHGVVLTQQDVMIGTWNFDSETFTPNTVEPNAVYVTTRRHEQNGNPVIMSFLRLLQIWGFRPWWNINAEAVAVQGVEKCLRDGLVAGGALLTRTHNYFGEYICLHGVKGFKHTNHNTYEDGVTVSVGCSGGDGKCLMPNAKLALRDEDFAKAFEYNTSTQTGGNYKDPLEPKNAEKIGDYLEAMLSLGQDYGKYGTEGFAEFLKDYNDNKTYYDGWEYLSKDGAAPSYYTGSTLPVNGPDSVFTPPDSDEGKYKVYHITCDGEIDFPSGKIRNAAIIFTCPIKFNNGTFDLENVMLAVDWDGASHGIHAAGKTDLGPDSCDDGGLELITKGSDIHFASSGNVANTRILTTKSIHFAAGASGHEGIHIEAMGDISMAAGAGFGLCPNPPGNFTQTLSYGLVR